jgi:hypothetical protein
MAWEMRGKGTGSPNPTAAIRAEGSEDICRQMP